MSGLPDIREKVSGLPDIREKVSGLPDIRKRRTSGLARVRQESVARMALPGGAGGPHPRLDRAALPRDDP